MCRFVDPAYRGIMFRSINNQQGKNQQPVAKDEDVRIESQKEDELKSLQSMGNEAVNEELKDTIKHLDLSDELIENKD